MKRKREQIVGADGELLDHAPEKRKRGRAGPQKNVLTLGISLGVVMLVGLMVFLAPGFRNQATDHLIATPNSIDEVSTQIVPLTAIERPTLKPEWTALPTDLPTLTATASLTPTDTPTATVTPEIIERIVHVSAQAAWQSGETIVQPGEVVEISYVTGRWFSWPGTGPFGPDGGFFYICDKDDCVEPLRGYSQAGMIGRIGEDGEMFPVGYRTSFVAEQSGEIQLRINDDYTTDNEGIITMRIIVKRYND
jgi:hypothetical protein